MTSMKKIQDRDNSAHVNVYSNMLHLWVKIIVYFSVSIKPLWEINKPPFPLTHVKNYSHWGLDWEASHRRTGPCLCGKWGEYWRSLSRPGSQPPSGYNSIYRSLNKTRGRNAGLWESHPFHKENALQFKFHSVRKTEGFKAAVTITILWEIIFP